MATSCKEPNMKIEDLKVKEYFQTLGETIKKERKLKGLTQKDFAVLVGSPQSEISRLEKGELNPSLKYLQKIAVVLDKKIKISFEEQ